MQDPAAAGHEVRNADGTAAFTQARALIEAAEADARQIVAFAARRARARENEAELLVAKARRLLVVAERKAEVILQVAREVAQAEAEQQTTIDLTEGEGGIGRFANSSGGRLGRPLPTRIESMLASAIANAVDEALPADAAV